MEKLLSILAVVIATLGLYSCTEVKASEQNKEEKVYICTGKYAKRFHCDEDCKGLQSCRSEIVIMSIEEAEDHGLTPCGYCY